jgi:VWFA-related protein
MRATRHPWPRFTPRAAALLTSAVLICTPALPLVAAVQDAPARAGQSIRREVNLVLVEATVKDKRGQVIGDLKQEDFRVTDNGQPQQIAHFSRDQLPLAVALVVDLSGSIQPFLRPLRYASMSALKALKPEDEVALITFSGEPELLVELTREKAEVADPFEDIRAEGGTNINDAVFEAANYLRDTAPAARRIIVLVSDNVPTVAGRVDHQEVVDAALKADAAVYGLKIPGRNPRGLNIVTGRSFRGLVNVKKLTEDTGGEIFDIEKEGSLFLAFQALIERLKTRYTLGYYPGSEARDADFHRLEVALVASRGAKDRDYTILAKTGYYPPAGRRPSR